MLSALFPEIIPYRNNWRPLEDHILYWTYAASLEHHVSFPHGGTSDPKNLITACYQCNDIKNMIRVDELGWKVEPIQDALKIKDPRTDRWSLTSVAMPTSAMLKPLRADAWMKPDASRRTSASVP